MADDFFYKNYEVKNIDQDFLNKIEKFSEENMKQVYIINKPLGESKYNYDYDKGIVLLIPKYKVIFIDFGNDDDEFNYYCEDFIEDLGYISDKYEYKKILGRPREWKKNYFDKIKYEDIKSLNIEEALEKYKLEKKEEERNSEFIISLLTGSINDVDRVGLGCPNNVLDQVKRKIVLFDGDQTKFIYNDLNKPRITIQGLAGTGKTELLLHKLKELYTKEENKESKIVLTCHNKILAENLKVRIPEFFNFMKVEEQIKWNERLWTVNGWGSQSNKDSGLYSYICNYYNIPFQRYSYSTTFNDVCKQAIENLSQIENFKPCFDYILIDESQDFPESFFALCEIVTKHTVYIAGDIFQNVFDEEIVSKVTPDYLLNKCYRTDPKTLMFAHAVGMGLFEKKLRWLADEEWEACGYLIDKKEGMYNLSRKPLRRFEDLDSKSLESIKIIPSEHSEYLSNILSIIENIKDENPTVKPDDIGIIFLENINRNYQLASHLEILIKEKFGWDVNLGYETKNKLKNSLFISNRNNVKGLEFPFVICIAQNKLSLSLQQRNSIYMMITRSFLTTYLIMPNSDSDQIKVLQDGINNINDSGVLSTTEPSEEEKELLRNAIINNNKVNKSSYELSEQIMDEMNVPKEKRETLHNMIQAMNTDTFDEEKVRELVNFAPKII